MQDIIEQYPTTSTSVRLAGIAGAIRFAWIPIVCALVVAIASEHAHGRALAAAIALLSLAIGLGEPLVNPSGAARDEIDAEWLKAVA